MCEYKRPVRKPTNYNFDMMTEFFVIKDCKLEIPEKKNRQLKNEEKYLENHREP